MKLTHRQRCIACFARRLEVGLTRCRSLASSTAEPPLLQILQRVADGAGRL